MNHPLIREVEQLFAQGGDEAYFGEQVSQLQHALQTAHCALLAQADEELIVAALLHDIGHLLGGQLDAEIGVIDHDRSCLAWLGQRHFSPRLLALVSGHVDAKRYLVTTNPDYYSRLSEASRKTLALQGGPMTAAEADAFAQSPYFRDLLRLRSWDEQAKDPSATPPGLAYFLPYLAKITSA